MVFLFDIESFRKASYMVASTNDFQSLNELYMCRLSIARLQLQNNEINMDDFKSIFTELCVSQKNVAKNDQEYRLERFMAFVEVNSSYHRQPLQKILQNAMNYIHN